MERRHDQEEGSGLSSRRRAKAYQLGMEAAFSIPIAIGIGYWADARWGTSPLLLFVGVGLGMGACVMRLLRLRKLVEATAREAVEAEEAASRER